MKIMINIAFFLNSLDIGGTPKTAQTFGKYIDKTRFNVEFFTYNDADLTRREKIESFAKINLINRNHPDFSILESFDIVHVFQSGYNEKPRPNIDYKKQKGFIITNVFGCLDSNPNIDRDLFMSKWLMDYALGGNTIAPGNRMNFLRGRFDYIDNPTELPFSNEKLDIKTGKNTIILGRSGRPDNGIYDDINVKAARNLKMKGYDIHFLVAAPPSNMVKDLTDFDIPFTIVNPTVDDVLLSQFYNTIDIGAMARVDGETNGLAMQEILIHAKPVVTHMAVPSIPGMGVFQAQSRLIKNGYNGYCVDHDIASYTEALEMLILDADLRKRMGQRAKKEAIENFEASVSTRKLENVYDGLLNV